MSKLSSEKRNRLNDSDFGIPEKRMYPLHDKAHIESAVRLFGHAENKYKRSLARKILSRAREYNMDTSGWKQVLSFAQEQVPPMSNGTSIGNAPPRMMAPYYDEQDELLQRANSMDPNSKETMFDKAKRIVTMIHNKTEQDSKPPTGNQNCQLCTWCAEAQFRGINALPRPVYSPRDPALEIKGENIVIRPVRRSFTSQRDIVETVRGAVDSRWYVHVNWAESTGGHEFLVVNLNDYAYIMDAQAGLLKEIDESDSSHNYFRDINFRNSYMVRLDDREFNTKLFNEMNDPSKVMPWNPELDVPYMKEHGMLGDMSDKWTMRPATKSDLEFVYFSELETVGENKNDPKVQQYIIEDAKESLGHTQIIVAENSDIGVYQAYATDYYGLREGKKDWWYLAHIYIKPEYRTLGIGSAIIKRDIAEHDKILLQVMKSNPRAKKLYESLGFVVTQENDHGGLIMRLDKTKPIKESFMDEYAKRVNDKGDPVPEKCKCGGKISITLKGEPIYSCEVCGKYYGTVPCNVQEGVIGKVIVGGITIFALINLAIAVKDAIKEKRYEKNTPTDEKLLTSIEKFLTYYNDLEYKDFLTDTGIRYEYIHDTMEDFDGHLKTIIKYTTECINTESNCYKSNEKMFEEFLTECKTTRAALWDIVCKLDDHIKDYDVDEHCIDETAMKYRKHYKTLLDQLMKHIEKFLKTLQKTIDSKNVVQEGVIMDFKDDELLSVLKNSKYGVAYHDKLITNPSEQDYMNKWHCLSPNEFINVGGGVCYDFVEWESDYLKKHKIPFKKFHISHHIGFDKTDVGKDAATHSICVAIVNGKYVYIEGSSKKLAKAMGYIKEFNNIDELLDFAVKHTIHEPDQDKLIIIDYTNVDNLIGLNLFDYQNRIFSKGKVIESDFIQEGAFQDLKNGVNPYSDNMVFHVTPDKHVDGQVWKPRVPDYLDPYNPEDTGFEDNTTPRICFSTSIEGALNGITVNIQRQSADTFDKMYVYIPEKPWKEYKHKTNKQLVKDKLVYDANVTREVWIMEPVRMKLYGVIRVDQIADAKRKSVVPTSKGQKDTRNYFTYKWHWVVKPKVLKKATKFDYSPERVIDDLCIDVKKFKYGLIKDGRLMTGNVSDADYNKYWVFHSGETVDQAGGGNCYDMVEYEAGYLEAFGVPYKKYFMNFTDTKNTKTINTHTICVVPHNGKFIYIEQAFKRVVDEWGYERKKVFDKLNDIFEYVAEVTAEYENQDLNYGVWDYTDAEIDYGTPIKNFMEWIFNNCTMIHDGEATKSKPIKEEYEVHEYDDDTIGESVTDMFIELGDMLFYVSEYHNALFDDPDAHEEAIREFGILLDSYDDIIQEVASYGPYDEYLKKHGYDPKSNTIEDPNRPGKRVSAGRIGSEKERRRMNKLLQDNGYDPKTETILTDIDDKNGGKQRVKLKIDAHRPALAGRKDADGDRYINMPPKELQHKPVSSNNVLKHEEGHINQYNNNDTPKSEVDIKRMNAAKDYVSNLDRDKIKADHDLKPTEYDADAYAAQHNKYDKKGLATMNSLAASSTNHERTVSKFEKTIDAEARKQGIRQDSPEYQNKQNIDFLLKHQDHPGGDANDLEWAEYLKKTHNNPEMFDKYLKFEEKKQQLNDLKKKRRTELGEIAAKYGSESDEYFDAADKWTAERKSYERELEKIAASPEFTKAEDMIEDLSDMSQLSPDQLRRRDQKETEKAFEFNKSLLRRKTNYRDPEEMKYAHQKRGEFAQQQWNEKNKEQQATEAKQRQLSKEQLQQQIASGQLTGDQAAKAERKIQRIEAFEKQQAQNQPIPKTKPVKPQTTNTAPPQISTSSDKPLSVQNQSLTTPPKQEQKPTIKKEGYKLNRFKSRFFQEEEEALSDTDDMEDITIGDLNLDDGDEKEEEEKISISDEELEDGGNTSSEEEGEDDFSADMEVPGYLKERMSEDDVESFEQPDEKLDADNVDLGQFGKDTSDVQNDYDPKEIDILMKLMASEADAMNEYMDGAKETNVDVLRRLYADIANEERFHMEQLLFAKSELTGEKYQPKDPEVKSEYEELLKMGMDEETAMQTAVDKCHIRGSITEDDGEKMVEIQQDVETMEMAISMFNAQFDNVLMMMESKSFKKEDVEHAVDVFVEACCVQEEVYNVNTDNNKGGYLNQGKASANPIDILRKGLGFILRVLRTLIAKFVEFLKRVRNHSRAIRTYVKRYGIEGIFASSKETTKMYFIDLDAPACINDSAETLLALTVDTYNACARSAGFQQQLPIGNLKRDSRFNIGGNIDKGIQILNGVQLIKTKMVIPKDKQKQEEIAACLFGYNEQRVTDSGESYNTLNRLKVMSDTWSAVLNGVNKQLEQMNTLRTQQGSIYYNNRKKYDLVIKGFETIIKTGKGVVTALQNDMNAIMKLNNEAMNISIQKTQQQDQDRMDKTPQLKQWNQNYKQNVDKGLK